MRTPLTHQGLIAVAPSAPLRDYVSHYWLSLDNADTSYTVLPDGAVDLVIEARGSAIESYLYGTTTTRTEVELKPRDNYLGIRFKPGQSRHFITLPAQELTDRRERAEGIVQFSLDSVVDRFLRDDVFDRINGLLEAHLSSRHPTRTRIDEAISLIQSTRGNVPIREAVSVYGRSARQFEREFHRTVGIPAKSLASIARFWHAAKLMSQPRESLAAIAVAGGYSDQSHMTHEFKRLTERTPAAFARDFVAFLQDPPH